MRFTIDGGATLYASVDPAAFDQRLLFAADSQDITIDGRGTIDGRAEYVWQTNQQHYGPAIESNRTRARPRPTRARSG